MKTLPVSFDQENAQPFAQEVTRGGYDPLAGGRLSSHSDSAIRHLPTDKLAASLLDIKEGLAEIFSSIKAVGDFELKEVKLTLEFTAEGGFALVGLAKAGAKGGITLSFTPPK